MSRAAWKGHWGGVWARYTGKWFHIQVRIGRVHWPREERPQQAPRKRPT